MATDLQSVFNECAINFEAGNLDTCAAALASSAERCDGLTALKVKLNQALVHYRKSGYTDGQEYYKVLSAAASEAKLAMEGSADDKNYVVLLYNYSVLSFHMGRYPSALRLLQRVLDSVIGMRQGFSAGNQPIRIIFREAALLLAELALIMGQAQKAQEYLGILEDENKYLRNSNATGGSRSDKLSSNNMSASFEPFKYRMQQAKIRTALCLRDSKSARKESKILSTFSQCQQFKSAFFKGQQEYQRGNFRKAIKFLTSIASADNNVPISDFAPALVQNDFGCVYALLSKPNLAKVYFMNALEKYKSASLDITGNKQGPIALSAYGNHLLRFSVLHNLALSLLTAGEPLQAFDIFLEVIPVFHNNPRLWLRLAECCIAADQLPGKCGQHFPPTRRYAKTVTDIIGMGPHRKLTFDFALASPGGAPVAVGGKSPHHLEGLNAAVPVATVQFAWICLNNALHLVQELETELGAEGELAEEEIKGVRPAPPGNLLSVREIQNLRAAILCAMAYVSLTLGDAITALKSAKALLKLPQSSNAQKLLAYLYAAEALVALNEIEEAQKMLTLQSFGALFPTMPEGEMGLGGYPRDAKSMAAIVAYNRALLYAMKADYFKASEILSQIDNRSADTQIPVHAVLLGLFLQLQMGRLDMAYLLIREQFPNVVLRVVPRNN